MRIFVDPLPRIADPHAVQHIKGDIPCLALDLRTVQQDGFAYLVPDGVYRREACHRLLKDHRDVPAPDTAYIVTFGIQRRFLCCNML